VQHLDAPLPDIAAALHHLGYVQIDPINVCGRMHDLILRNRLAGYREGDLMRHLHGTGENAANGDAAPPSPAPKQPPENPARPAAGEAPSPRERGTPLAAEQRTAFEHHLPGKDVLVAFPLAAWPHLLGEMQARARRAGRWSGRLTPREKTLATHLLAEIARRGPLASEDFADDRAGRRVWGATTLVKATLQKLFFHGRLLIAQRANNRRRYDLPERVLPAATLAQPLPTHAETARWLALLKLRQRRLALLTREELRLVADVVQPVAIENCPPLHCLQEDAALLAGIAEERATEDGQPPPAPALRLLAPLDPLIYDRRVAAALWNFDYTWEVYTPPHKRVRGYYALPVLAGTELVGHVDPKADRAARKLIVQARSLRRGYSVAEPLRELAAWLGLKTPRR
jgi:uncharacterized protein YcaQ